MEVAPYLHRRAAGMETEAMRREPLEDAAALVGREGIRLRALRLRPLQAHEAVAREQLVHLRLREHGAEAAAQNVLHVLHGQAAGQQLGLEAANVARTERGEVRLAEERQHVRDDVPAIVTCLGAAYDRRLFS